MHITLSGIYIFTSLLENNLHQFLLWTLFGLNFLFSKKNKDKKKLQKNTTQNLNEIYDLIYEQPQSGEDPSEEEMTEDPIKLQRTLIQEIKTMAEREKIDIGIASKDGLPIVTSSSDIDESFLGISTGLYDYIRSRVFRGLKKVTVAYEENEKEKSLHIVPIEVHGDNDYLIIVSKGRTFQNENVIIENILGYLKKYKFIDPTGEDKNVREDSY